MDAHAQTLPAANVPAVPTNKLAMWLFLASEVMFFTGLIGTYIVLRFGSPSWPSPGQFLVIPLGAVNTFIPICSSMTMVLAFQAADQGNVGALRRYLFLTVLLGSAFLGIKGYEYSRKFAHGYYPSTGLYWSCYFTLTGFHGLHVLGGVITNLVLWIQAMRRRLPPEKSYVVELAGLYWHFVDIVWIFLFPIVYLL